MQVDPKYHTWCKGGLYADTTDLPFVLDMDMALERNKERKRERKVGFDDSLVFLGAPGRSRRLNVDI